MSDCKNCMINNKCKKPYECEEMYQMQYLGRSYTKKEWEKEGICTYFKPILKEDEKSCNNCGLTIIGRCAVHAYSLKERHCSHWISISEKS